MNFFFQKGSFMTIVLGRLPMAVFPTYTPGSVPQFIKQQGIWYLNVPPRGAYHASLDGQRDSFGT